MLLNFVESEMGRLGNSRPHIATENHFRSVLALVKVEDRRRSEERYMEPTIVLPASLAMDRMFELHLRSGLSLSPDTRSRYEISLREFAFVTIAERPWFEHRWWKVTFLWWGEI